MTNLQKRTENSIHDLKSEQTVNQNTPWINPFSELIKPQSLVIIKNKVVDMDVVWNIAEILKTGIRE